MLRHTLLLIACLSGMLLAVASRGQSAATWAGPYTFRGSSLGMSLPAFRSANSLPEAACRPTRLTITCEWQGQPNVVGEVQVSDASYTFYKGKLFSIVFLYEPQFLPLVWKAFTAKYGNAVKLHADDTVWVNPSNNDESIRLSIYAGRGIAAFEDYGLKPPDETPSNF